MSSFLVSQRESLYPQAGFLELLQVPADHHPHKVAPVKQLPREHQRVLLLLQLYSELLRVPDILKLLRVYQHRGVHRSLRLSHAHPVRVVQPVVQRLVSLLQIVHFLGDDFAA